MTAAALPLTDPASGRPLQVLITRPSGQAEETASLVEELGGAPLVAPCLRLAPPEDSPGTRGALLAALSRRPHAMAFSSANAVHATCRLLGEEVARLSAPGIRLAAVGPQTARALSAHGLVPTLVAEGGTGASLAEALSDSLRVTAANGTTAMRDLRVLLPRPEEGRMELEEVLLAAGCQVEALVVYRMLPATPAELSEAVAALAAGAVDLVPLGSPRTVEILLAALAAAGPGSGVLGSSIVGAIGETTQKALRAAGVAVDYVLAPPAVSFQALLQALAAAYRRKQSTRSA